jgi:hypothetical protein
LRLTGKQWRTGTKPVPCKTAEGKIVMFYQTTDYLGLDWNVIMQLADKKQVPQDDEFFEKLYIFESAVLNILTGGDKSGPCSKDDRDNCIYEMGGEEYLEWKCKQCKKKQF